MPRFTYEQCDLIHRKMNRFDSVVDNINTNSKAINRSMAQNNKTSLTGVQSKSKVLLDKDFNVQKKLLRNYETLDNKKYVQKELAEKKIEGKQNFLNFPNQSLQYSSIQPRDVSSQQSISRILEQGYSTISDPNIKYRSNQQKSETIHELNSQIKRIMSKYDYEFSQAEVKGLVGDRITLPSFREMNEKGKIVKTSNELKHLKDYKEVRRIWSDKQNKQIKSSGYIKVQEAASEQEIKKPIPEENNQFSPYSDREPSPQAKQSQNQMLYPKVSKLGINLNQHIIMSKSQLIEDHLPKNQNKKINLNKGQNGTDFVPEKHISKLDNLKSNTIDLESSQKKKARYMNGYTNMTYNQTLNRQKGKKNNLLNQTTYVQGNPQAFHKPRKNTRLLENQIPKNRSELIDRSIEELNERIKQVQEQKRRLNMELKPFNLNQFKAKLFVDKNAEISCGNRSEPMEMYPSFEIKSKITDPVQNEVNEMEIPKIPFKNESPEEPIEIPKLQNENSNAPIEQPKQIFQESSTSICQIDNLFNSVTLTILPPNQTRPNENLEIKNFDQKVEHIQFQDSSIQKSIKHQASLSLVSGTNIVKITKDKSLPFEASQKSFIQEAPTRSAQKRLNKSSLMVKKPQNTKNAFELLLINLIQQICLDQEFRNLKTWFQFYFEDTKKYQSIKNKLLERLSKKKERLEVRKQFQSKIDEIHSEETVIKILERDIGQIEKVFSVSVHEHDPFFKLDTKVSGQTVYNGPKMGQGTFCIETLIENYEACQFHWAKNLYRKLSSKNLLSSGFSAYNLDLQHKGYIEIQDLVRLVNMNVGACYRSRDFFMIWERIQETKISDEKYQTLFSDFQQGNPKTHQIEFKYLLITFAEKDKI